MIETDEYNQLIQNRELTLLMEKENNIYHRYFQVHLFWSESGMDGYTSIVKIEVSKLKGIPVIFIDEKEEKGFDWVNSLYESAFKELLIHLQNNDEEIKKDVTQADYVIDEVVEISEKSYINGGYYA